jgi:ABC-2 type transport system ATP-binding protein
LIIIESFIGPPGVQRSNGPTIREVGLRRRIGTMGYGRRVTSIPVLRCEGLVRRFGERTAVGGVGFEIGAGETYGLLGPNGAGKTTTISMIAGILAADDGTVTVAGHGISTGAGAGKRRIGLVPQQIALIEDLSARENLRFFGGLQGLRGAELATRIAATLELVGLTDRADDRVSEFSGGMQRRANIAVGLLHEPSLLILDEPTAGVDPQSRNQILDSVASLTEGGMAVLYTTHYMEEAERLCDRVGIIDQGRLVAEGTRRELVARVGDHDRIAMRVDGDPSTWLASVRSLTGVVSAESLATDGSTSGRGVEVLVDSAPKRLAELVTSATAGGLSIVAVDVAEPDLESVFLHLTGRALRDAASA